ncbi:MAG: hypothetical protein ACRDRA_19555 [Pseudonocardiaceae bacterium]
MSGRGARPDQHVLLELDALLEQIQILAADGDRERFDKDDRYRWVLHRLWIAVGNEALAYARLTGHNPQVDQPWARLYRLRNMLAHDRLPDIDEDEVWRMTAVRPAALRAQVRGLLR